MTEGSITSVDETVELGDSYQHLMESSIDNLNTAHDFSGSDFNWQQKAPVASVKFFRSPLFLGLCVLIALNLMVYGYHRWEVPGTLPQQAADQQVRERLAPHGTKLNSLVTIHDTSSGFRTPDDLTFQEVLSTLSIDAYHVAGQEIIFPENDEFRVHGKGVTWSGKAQEPTS